MHLITSHFITDKKPPRQVLSGVRYFSLLEVQMCPLFGHCLFSADDHSIVLHSLAIGSHETMKRADNSAENSLKLPLDRQQLLRSSRERELVNSSAAISFKLSKAANNLSIHESTKKRHLPQEIFKRKMKINSVPSNSQ